MTDVRTWLESIGLGDYVGTFAQNRIDGEVLPHLTEQDLTDLGLPIGPRRMALVAIRALIEAGAQPHTAERNARPQGAERRQITVLFCDLVDSTALSARLDAEDLRAIMQAYRRAAAAVIDRYDGHVAQYLGDGLMSYFGWPVAHEDDAQRAALAALGIIESVHGLTAGVPLHVRIGIASGPVVVGDTGEDDGASLATGETPNLAARLQGLAGQDQIVVAPSTRRLIGAAFELADLGPHALKGITEPVHVWRVVDVAPAEGRFEALHAGRLTPFVGRLPELELLLERWERARDGEGQAALVSGEAGIGKSRLAQMLVERAGVNAAVRVLYQCSPYHANSSLHPVIEHLQRAAQFERTDDAAARLDKLETFLSATREDVPAVAPLLAALLSLDSGGRYPPAPLSPQAQKEATLQALVAHLSALAVTQPVLVIVEDVHWIDPTTQEMLDLLLPAVASQRIMLLITCRPEYHPDWSALGHLTALPLTRLARSDAQVMVQQVTGDKPLPMDVLDQILDRTEGVPLFVEELTKSVVEGEAAGTVAGIPSTLQDSLMARLDRAAPMREVAQIGACIGRQFSRDLLAAIAPLDRPTLDAALRQLADAGLVFGTGDASSISFVFKHALLQDAAYNSLLRSRRQEVHARIAATLVRDFPETAESAPETLAHHCMEAGDFESAARYWRVAAEHASARFANKEAIAHARGALKALERLPPSNATVDAELALRMTVAGCLRIIDHYDEALDELERAQALATAHRRLLALARLHHLRGNIYFPLGQVERCLAEHQAASQFAREAGSTEEEARALGGVGDAHYMAGRMRPAHEQFDRCVALCRMHGLDAIERAYLPMRATTHMYSLRFHEALEDCRQVNELIARAGQARGEILSRNISSWILLEQHDLERAEQDARRGYELVERLGARRFAPLFDYIIARILLLRGDHDGAAGLLERSWDTCRKTGVTFIGPFVLGLLALASGDPDRRRDALREGQAILDRGCVSHNYFWFYRHAMDVRLADSDWKGVAVYADALQRRFSADPLPWADYVSARARALVQLEHDGLRDSAVAQLHQLREEVVHLGLHGERLRIEAALGRYV